MSEFGSCVTAMTVRIAVALFVLRFVAQLVYGDQSRIANQRIPRWIFSTGLLFYLVHVACAFHFYHDWSHSKAFCHTAVVTTEKLVSFAIISDWEMDSLQSEVANDDKREEIENKLFNDAENWLKIKLGTDTWNTLGRPIWDRVGKLSGFGLYLNYLFSLLWIADVSVWWLRPDWRTRGVKRTIQPFYFFIIFNATVVFGPFFWLPVVVMTFPGVFCVWMIVQLTSEAKR